MSCHLSMCFIPLRQISDIYFGHILLGQASDIYEVLERHRVEKISASLTKFCSLERKYLESRLQHLELLETGAVAKLDPEADVNSFVNANKKPLDTLRRSYAVQILQLSHLSRYVHHTVVPCRVSYYNNVVFANNFNMLYVLLDQGPMTVSPS